MAPRPGYGIPLGRWYITNGSSGFRNRKINNSFHWRDITDDWKKFSRDGDFNVVHYIIKLKTCGTLKSWKRVKDQSGNPKGFGFAEYADADSVLRALRVLGGEGSGDDKKVNIKADENTRKYLAQYEASRPGTVHENKLAHRTSPATEIKTEHGEKDDDTDLPADLPPDQKDLRYLPRNSILSRTCCSKRTRASERRGRTSKSERERERERERDRDRQYGHYHQPVNFVPASESRRESYILDDKE
ncbi:hypothetical protein RhiirB3_452864 [Rhizophagus irregularis]|nr:hypothetical protein RhiirB3_452864 [Rhizophagus irregularis]